METLEQDSTNLEVQDTLKVEELPASGTYIAGNKEMTIFVDGKGCSKSPTGQHVWDGEEIDIPGGSSSTCSHCGELAFNWCMMNLP